MSESIRLIKVDGSIEKGEEYFLTSCPKKGNKNVRMEMCTICPYALDVTPLNVNGIKHIVCNVCPGIVPMEVATRDQNGKIMFIKKNKITEGYFDTLIFCDKMKRERPFTDCIRCSSSSIKNRENDYAGLLGKKIILECLYPSEEDRTDFDTKTVPLKHMFLATPVKKDKIMSEYKKVEAPSDIEYAMKKLRRALGYADMPDMEQSSQEADPLKDVLNRAYAQATSGKGKERHNEKNVPFIEQPIMQIAEAHGVGFLTGQAAKKLEESSTLFKLKGKQAAMDELLGAIVYAAAAVIYYETNK